MIEHLSHSSLALFHQCGRAWRFKYVEQQPTDSTPSLVFGTAFHGAIEQAIRLQHCGAAGPDAPDRLWQDAWDAAVERTPVAWGDVLPEQLGNEGYRLFASAPVQDLIPTLAPLVDDAGPFIERRVEIRIPAVPVPVIGFIDLVGADGVPVDFKTSARAWTPHQAASEVQPLYYHTGLAQSGYRGNPEGRFRHVVFVKGRTPQVQVLETTHTPSELFWLAGVIREAWRAIDQGVFAPNPGGCFAYGRKCEFWGLCRGRR